MYGLPERFNGDCFVGSELDIVTFASNVVLFGFGDDCSVSAMSAYGYSLETGGNIFEESAPVRESRVPSLLGLAVLRVEVQLFGELNLHFPGGAWLLFRDDSDVYESYIVSTPEEEIIV